MLNLCKCYAGLLAAIAVAAPALAQEKEIAKFYKLDFVVKELEGSKVLNARSYSTLISADTRNKATISTGSKVPFQISPQVQYADVGVNIDCYQLRETDGGLMMEVAADISSIPQQLEPGKPPVVRQNKWSSAVIVPIHKATLLFSSDDPASRQQMQLELTATPIR